MTLSVLFTNPVQHSLFNLSNSHDEVEERNAGTIWDTTTIMTSLSVSENSASTICSSNFVNN